MAKPSPIPEGAHTVTASMTHTDCARAIDFYKRALGAEELMRMPSPDGKRVWHAEIRVGDSIMFLADEMPNMPSKAPSADRPSPVAFWVWVADCDAAHRRAVESGARSTAAPTEMFWGDRTGGIADPFGYSWTFATHVKDLTREEMARGADEFARKMGMKG